MIVHHIGYLVKDIDKSKDEFVKLGFIEETAPQYDSLRDIIVMFMVNGDYRIELIEPASENSEMMPLLKRFKNLPYHICYKTTDIKKSIDELLASGFVLIKEPKEAPCIDGCKVAFLQNPRIGIVELVCDKD